MSRPVIVTVLGSAQIIAYGTTYYLLTVLAPHITTETGWPSGWIFGSFTIALLVSGLVSPRVGRVIDRFGGRPVLVSSAVFLAAGLAMLGISPTLPVFTAGWVIIGIGMGTGLYDPAFSTLGRLYGENARSAITYVTLFGGFASTVCWPLSAFLTGYSGWRFACFTYAAVHAFIVLPLYLFLIPSEEELIPSSSVPPDGLPGGKFREEGRTGKTAKGAKAAKAGMRSFLPLEPDERKVFFLLAAGQTLASVVITILAVHILVLLQARGVSLAVAVGLGALLGPSQVGARILEAIFGRRLHPVWSLVAATAAVAAGLGLMTIGAGFVTAGIIIYGAGNGVRSIARGTVPLAIFGREGYASLMGMLSMPVLLMQAASPLLGLALIKYTGAESTMFILCIISVLNILIAAALIPYTRQQAPAAVN